MHQHIYKTFGQYLGVLPHNRFGILCLIMAAAFAISCKDDHQPPASREPQKATAGIGTTPESDLQKYVLDELDNTAGLSNSSVNCIFQDSQNLIWIGTWDGLNRYDGSSFKIFSMP